MEHSQSPSNLPSNPVDLLSVQHKEYQAQIAKLQQQVQNQQEEIERYQCQFDEVLAELEQCNFELHQTQGKLHQFKAELESTQLLMNHSHPVSEQSDVESVLTRIESSLNQCKPSSSEIFLTYQSRIEQNPELPQNYQDLGMTFLQQGYWLEALSCYRRSITLNPEYQKQCFLDQVAGNLYYQIPSQKLSILPDQKTEITPSGHLLSVAGNEGFVLYGPYIDIPDGLYRVSVSFEFPESHQGDENIGFVFDVVSPHPDVLYETSIHCYQNSLEFYLEFIDGKRTEFRFFAKGYAFIVKEIELTLIYSPESDTNSPFYYFDLGSLLQNKGLIDKASLAYNQAIELSAPISLIDQLVNASKDLPFKPEWGDAYLSLGDLLNQQNYIDAAIACYKHLVEIAPQKTEAFHQLGILLTEKGQLKEAVILFQKAQRPPSLGEIYEQIWKGLNQLAPLDEHNPYLQTEIQPDTTYEYFSQTSQYKIINLEKIIDADRTFLEEAHISVEYLKLMVIEKLALEKIYINNFNKLEPPLNLSQIKVKKEGYTWPLLNPKHFQQSLIQTGYIYTVCPISGQILRTNQSILTSFMKEQIIIYRFQGQEVFYLAVGGWSGGKIFAYFPRLEIIVHLCKEWSSWLPTTTIVNRLKADLTNNWKKVKSYIYNHQPKKVVAIVGYPSNLGHYIWNDLSGIEFLEKNQLLTSIDKFIITSKNRFDIVQIFPDIKPEQVVYIENSEQKLKTILDENYCAVRVTDSSISAELAHKIYLTSLQNCNSEFMDRVAEAKTHFPLLWINLRSHDKSWLNQSEGYANIISKLAENYPNLAVVFDGVPDVKPALEKIESLIPASIKIYSAVDCSLYETTVWANTIDLYIAVIGSGLTLVTWLANKPGVAHSDRGHYSHIHGFWLEVREDIIEPTLVPIDAITDVAEHNKQAWFNYYCDWQEIYYQVIQVMKTLPQKAGFATKD